MSLAWEVTTEDVKNVLDRNNVDVNDYEFLDTCMDTIDGNAVEREALRGDDMLEQSDLAEQEIERQLIDAGII